MTLKRACIAIFFLSLAAVLGTVSASADTIVANGNFSQGSAGWTLAKATQDSDIRYTQNFDGYPAAAFGAYADGYYDTISQKLNTLPGNDYTVSFLLRNQVLSANADFQVLWNGKVVLDVPGNSTKDYGGYQSFTVNVDSTSSSSELSFAGYNQADWYYLTDVSVTSDGPANSPTPEASSILLLGSGILAMAAAVRRKPAI